MPAYAPHLPSAPSLDPTDRSLVALSARGDQEAFEALFRRHRGGIHAYALRMLRDHAYAEDLVQDVFVSAMRAIQAGQRPEHVRAWLHEIARRACIDHWRGSERRREVSYDAPDGLSVKDAGRMSISSDVALRSAADRESLALLRCAFGDLPPMQHAVLVQRELEGRSPREIAERLGVSRTVVEGQLARGRRQLAVAYRELQSGERCESTRELCESSLDRPLGVRDRTRMRIHMRSCDACRRHAHDLGVEQRLIDLRILAQLGMLLPLPLLRRLPFGHAGLATETAGGVVTGKVLVGAAVLAASGGGALVATDVTPITAVPRASAAAEAAPAGGASGGSGASASTAGNGQQAYVSYASFGAAAPTSGAAPGVDSRPFVVAAFGARIGPAYGGLPGRPGVRVVGRHRAPHAPGGGTADPGAAPSAAPRPLRQVPVVVPPRVPRTGLPVGPRVVQGTPDDDPDASPAPRADDPSRFGEHRPHVHKRRPKPPVADEPPDTDTVGVTVPPAGPGDSGGPPLSPPKTDGPSTPPADVTPPAGDPAPPADDVTPPADDSTPPAGDASRPRSTFSAPDESTDTSPEDGSPAPDASDEAAPPPAAVPAAVGDGSQGTAGGE